MIKTSSELWPWMLVVGTITSNIASTWMKRKVVRDGLKSSVYEVVDEWHRMGCEEEEKGKEELGSNINR